MGCLLPDYRKYVVFIGHSLKFQEKLIYLKGVAEQKQQSRSTTSTTTPVQVVLQSHCE